ncbi:hypothetical protein CUD01_24680 [Cellulomonas uda]|uniref:Uncharacterized protein n=1 Tax=Cellulomonas uda TaxID=1714 RepID=A0A4Y3KF53_CELUD|nr:hypothetical protein CUD01_24680 [Cellulomonas uda]
MLVKLAPVVEKFGRVPAKAVLAPPAISAPVRIAPTMIFFIDIPSVVRVVLCQPSAETRLGTKRQTGWASHAVDDESPRRAPATSPTSTSGLARPEARATSNQS